MNRPDKDSIDVVDVVGCSDPVYDTKLTDLKWQSDAENAALHNPGQAAIENGCASLNQLCMLLHIYNVGAGWWDTNTPETPFVKLVLVHSEISEAVEGLRKDLMDTHLPHRKMVEVELADALIRIMDVAGALKLDIAGALAEKFAYNTQRQDHRREARAGKGGKKV